MDSASKNKIPVDLVYLWCSDADENWHNKRLKFLIREKGLDEQAAHPCRYANHDELKYSLRSVAKYASWINKIFIVSDHQIPDWLNLKNTKIKMVWHEDILPKKVLPVFNSMAIETGLGNIADLSEHFLYANDDAFFGGYVGQDFFFRGKEKAIIRFSKKPAKRKIISSQYSRNIVVAQSLAKEHFGVRCDWFPHHNIDAYFKSDYQNCMEVFRKEINQTLCNRFRQDGDLERVIVSYYMMAKGHAIIKLVKNIDVWLSWKEKLKMFLKGEKNPDSMCVNVNSQRGVLKINRINPKLFCINDTEKGAKEQVDVKDVLEQMFPEKSEFEI